MSDDDSGFLVPPGLSGQLSRYFDENYDAALNWLGQLTPGSEGDGSSEPLIARKLAATIEVPDELLMDYGVIPDTRPPRPPLPWHWRVKWKVQAARTRLAEIAYRAIAGDWPDYGEDE